MRRALDTSEEGITMNNLRYAADTTLIFREFIFFNMGLSFLNSDENVTIKYESHCNFKNIFRNLNQKL